MKAISKLTYHGAKCKVQSVHTLSIFITNNLHLGRQLLYQTSTLYYIITSVLTFLAEKHGDKCEAWQRKSSDSAPSSFSCCFLASFLTPCPRAKSYLLQIIHLRFSAQKRQMPQKNATQLGGGFVPHNRSTRDRLWTSKESTIDSWSSRLIFYTRNRPDIVQAYFLYSRSTDRLFWQIANHWSGVNLQKKICKNE